MKQTQVPGRTVTGSRELRALGLEVRGDGVDPVTDKPKWSGPGTASPAGR